MKAAEKNKVEEKFKVGERIRLLREIKKMTQSQISGIMKMDQGQYSRLEKDSVDPSLTTLVKVAKALNVSLQDLFIDSILWEPKKQDKSSEEILILLEGMEKADKDTVLYIIEKLTLHKKMKDSVKHLLIQ